MANKHKKGEIAYTFAAMPVEVLQSEEWQNLPPSAIKLAMDLVAQYTGGNNGRLCPAFEVMQRAGWASRTTLIAAKRALIECSFVIHTRQGKAPRTSDWVGFTWWKLNWEKSMDIEPKGWPHLNFMSVKPKDQGRSFPAPQKTLRGVQKLDRSSPKQPPGRTETGPMEASKTDLSIQKLYVCPNEEAIS